MVHYYMEVFILLLVRILTFATCSSLIRPVLKQACPSERILSHLCMNRAINISLNTSFLSLCRQNGDTRVRATAGRLCAIRAPHVRCTYDTHSQRARASSVGKTPSFRLCQVDMYEYGLTVWSPYRIGDIDAVESVGPYRGEQLA